uniref:Uncharacterized protein n=2 Tax=Oryza TaxID=4527 RepID=Q5Z6Z9_ORYSJ|nr:hypothetical protein [Oryza sativa Japonica Group]
MRMKSSWSGYCQCEVIEKLCRDASHVLRQGSCVGQSRGVGKVYIHCSPLPKKREGGRPQKTITIQWREAILGITMDGGQNRRCLNTNTGQARLTLEFFGNRLPEKKLQLVDMSILLILLSPRLGCYTGAELGQNSAKYHGAEPCQCGGPAFPPRLRGMDLSATYIGAKMANLSAISFCAELRPLAARARLAQAIALCGQVGDFSAKYTGAEIAACAGLAQASPLCGRVGDLNASYNSAETFNFSA